MKKLIVMALAITSVIMSANAKKVIDHSMFDDWKFVKTAPLSDNGEWVAYAAQAQEGDGYLTLRNTKTGKTITIPRGYQPKFTADSRWAIALIKPLFADTRKAKIDKKKDFDLPQDTLAIIDLKSGKVTKTPNVTAFKIGKDGGSWVAYTSVDTLHIKAKELKDKKAGKPLVVLDLNSGNKKVIKNVKDYNISKNGKCLGVTLKKAEKDSLSTDGIGVMLLPDTSFVLIDRDRKFYGSPVFNEACDKMAFTASNDTIETGTLHADLFLTDLTAERIEPRMIETARTERKAANLAPAHGGTPEENAALEKERIEAMKKMAGKMLYANQYSKPVFSHDGKRLIIGLAPEVAPDDTTIVDFERADLDIWRWDAPMTPPQELKAVEKLRKHTFPLVINLGNGSQQLLTTNPLVTVTEGNRWDGDWAMLTDPTREAVSRQWDYTAPEEISVINVNNGNVKKMGTTMKESAELSPAGKYVIWYDSNRNYNVWEIATGENVEVSSAIPYPVWEEHTDYPMIQTPYGIGGWLENDEAVLIYDKHDIWSVDPKGKRAPVCLTAGDGRKKNLRYRYVKIDPEERALKNGQEMILSVFNYDDKKNGLATAIAGKSAAPSIKDLDGYQYTRFSKAKNAPVYSFEKSNFSECPDVWISRGTNFGKAFRISDLNPQMKDYYWGTAELVKWRAFDGREVEGVLYKPEDFDPEKKYPMIAYFYEQNTEELYHHYALEPSWSWINFPFYTSRGYVVFVPDVYYTPGVPGEGAYNCIVSGCQELCRRYPWIDKDHIGIDGQSWGGYQTAYLVTRTDMFACAGSGAPVANMTSAFGGIRWGTGDSRQAQYEQGQSRIGRNLWEAPELYIANSPLFHLDRVNTPVLIMHNDQDGAVPWYQGIELFMGLRRLHKPVWMLQYNGEDHNIRARKNRKDITIRFQQFFDHYLKGAPMPEWMKNGIPAIRKGQEMGTGLVTD
ncbi:MAG: S9 family peptidase [Muribaculaceae bacterium]|nr:S9 family peptidase [Muribaculaceae bacterium]